MGLQGNWELTWVHWTCVGTMFCVNSDGEEISYTTMQQISGVGDKITA